MAARRLGTALNTFARALKEAKELADDARQWAIPPAPGARARITNQRRDLLTEIAFLRAFTGWEIFLEETFLLYLLGHRPPRGNAPRRYGFPQDKDAASEWCSDGKGYAKWGVVDVRRRADRWFKDGKPFTPALQSQQSRLEQLVTIRNAIAHESSSARGKFENVVRTELQALPPGGITVGGFLVTLKPNSNPPISYLDFYLEQVQQVALNIVPR
jgi:hypothetical protein